MMCMMAFLFTLLFAVALSQSYNELPTGHFRLSTYVFNIFPVANVSAFVVFEQERVSRLQYGEFQHINATFTAHSDFIVQFREMLTDAVRSDFTDFGFMESELSPNKEIILLIRRNSVNHRLPQHHLLIFDTDTIESDSSKLYLYNAVHNTQAASQGLYIYGLYQRRNSDGSESESITQLTTNLRINTGTDINIQPMTRINIKGFYSPISSVLDFKDTKSVVHYDNFIAGEGRQRKYLVAFGDFTSYNSTSITRPRLVVLEEEVVTSTGTVNNPFIYYIIMTVAIMLLL